MVVAVFRARVRPEFAAEYYALADDMAKIARSMPGFISWKVYTSADGERLSVHEWQSADELRAWRKHPEHVKVQQLGRDKYYGEYTLYVCDQPRESRFAREG